MSVDRQLPDAVASGLSDALPGPHATTGEVSGQCQTIRETFSWMGDKWTLLVVRALSGGPQRFTSLKQSVDGISQRMLTLTLRKLERDGLVRRTVFPEIPPRVEYELTSLGATLMHPVSVLASWAIEYHDAIEDSRSNFDAATGSGLSEGINYDR